MFLLSVVEFSSNSDSLLHISLFCIINKTKNRSEMVRKKNPLTSGVLNSFYFIFLKSVGLVRFEIFHSFTSFLWTTNVILSP